MRSFQSESTFDPVPSRIVRVLGRIDRSAGAEARFADQLPNLLLALQEEARIESITASSAIEGVIVDGRRVPNLVSGRTRRFRDRSEEEFAGYTDALDYLNGDDPGQLSVGLILHLHRLPFARSDGEGGRFKSENNLVIDRSPDGTRTVRFIPVSAGETPHYVEELVARTNTALAEGTHHPLTVISAFALDLLCIHPFTDGNGRTARLITGHLLQRQGYGVGRYLSLEQLIYDDRDGYYAALGASTAGWLDGTHDLWPWAGYLLDRLDRAYELLTARVASSRGGGTKQERVRDFVLNHAGPTFSISDIRHALPGISDNTIRVVLTQLRDAGSIVNSGAGRGSMWRRSD